MPELPEVETVRRGLIPSMEGAKIVHVAQNRADLRFPFADNFVEVLEGSEIVEIKRRSKYLLFHLDNGFVLVAHLGMSGSFRVIEEPLEADEAQPGAFHIEKGKNEKHDHVVMKVEKDGASAKVIYNDPRRFGFMLLVRQNELDVHPYFKDLGPEPTGNGISIDYLADKFSSKNTPLKSTLLDQKIIAGLGNIYVCEALWRTKLSPLRKAKTLVKASGKPKQELIDLSRHIQDVIDEAIKAGGSSLNDHIQTDGSLGYFQHSFAAYGQENSPCRHGDCTGTIERITQSGRSTFYCADCQK
jgi:formamidopyrimidine-DNA glycosylase